MSQSDDNNRVLDQIGEEILRAHRAGDGPKAAHFAGVARQLIDPHAPAPPPYTDAATNHHHVGGD